MDFLDGIELLSSLSESERKNLEMFCQEKKVAAGEVIFFENDYATAMYLLKKGSIEITRKVEGGKIILGEVHSEEILGEMAMFGDRNKRMATATALTDCTLIVILEFSINDLIKKHPDLSDKIKLIINDRLISNKEKIS